MKRYTTKLVPTAIRRRASIVRRNRGTDVANVYLHTYLHHASILHARTYAARMFGRPWRRALASLFYGVLLGAPILYLLHGALDPILYIQVCTGALAFTVGRALLAAVHTGAPAP